MDKRETKFNTNSYCELFRGEISECPSSDSNNNFLGFTVYFDAKDNRMSKHELFDRIIELSMPPHGIFEDKEGYLVRYELLEPISIADDEHEANFRRMTLRFLERNIVVRGKLEEMEIGRWIAESVEVDDDCEVIECL